MEFQSFGQGHSVETSLSVSLSVLGAVNSHSTAVSDMQRVQKVRDAIEEMEEVDREVLALRHFEELTNKEVAEALGRDEEPRALLDALCAYSACATITMGADGAWFARGDERVLARGSVSRVVSAVGAGDCMTAGIALGPVDCCAA